MTLPSRIKYPLLAIGLGMLAVAAYLSWERLEFLRAAQTAQGIVIELVSNVNAAPAYAPRVSFLTPDGVQHEFSSNVYNSPPSFSVGEQTEVLYIPGNPSDAAINTPFQLWAGSLITGLIGSLSVFLSRRKELQANQGT